MINVYIINGAPGAGKDTFCEILGEYTYVKILSTVDFVKEIAIECGWNGEKTPNDRKFLSDLKNLLTQWRDVPFNRIKRNIENINKYLDYMNCFVMCREPEEIERLRQEFSAKTIIIRREVAENAEFSNDSDANVLNYDYDISINNNSDLENLRKEAKKFIINEKIKVKEWKKDELS